MHAPLFVFDPGVIVTVPLVLYCAVFIVSWPSNVDTPDPLSDACRVSVEIVAVPEKSTPMQAVVAVEPGSRLVTSKSAVPVEVAEPPCPPWLSSRRMVFVENVFELFALVTVHTAQEPSPATIPKANTAIADTRTRRGEP